MDTQISVTAPGEGATIAIFALAKDLMDGQTADQKKIIWDQVIAITSPWNAIAAEISKDAAGFIGALIGKLKQGS